MFKPYIMLDKITDIDVESLKNLNVTTIMTDLDNTLLPWNSNEYDLSLRKWLNQMAQNDIEVMIVSTIVMNEWRKPSETCQSALWLVQSNLCHS
jgi:Predicted hydrolase of the HAD superfamily